MTFQKSFSRRIALASTFSLLFAGCSQLGLKSHPTATKATETPTESKADTPVSYSEFDPETLYALMTAEIAAQRGRFDVTLLNYVQQAKRTRDVAVIQRAVRISQFLKAENALYELSRIWAEVEPGNIEANQLAAFHSARKKEYETAIGYMEKTLGLGGEADFDALAVHAQSLSPEEQAELLALYKALHERHPDTKEVIYGYALMQKAAQNSEDALTTITPLLESAPDYQPAIILYAGLLFDTGKLDDSLNYLRKQTRRFPDNKKMGTLYARMLIDAKDLEQAQEVFYDLMTRFSDTPSLKLSYALVSLEKGDRSIAKSHFEELLENQNHTNEAHFYLGRIDDQDGHSEAAIKHYLQVESGTHYFAALARVSYLRAINNDLDGALSQLEQERQKHEPQAENIWLIEVNLLLDLGKHQIATRSLNAALSAFPDNTKLLYSRAMLADRLGDLPAMEQDLRKIIALEPQNAVALNALGYTLADKTKRLMEALELISTAHQLKPDNPAILDSLGWIYFRLGNHEESLDYLKKAFDKFPDPEVAAHLGEVLWATGNKEEALKIWQDILKDFPDNKLITETMTRLGAAPASN